MVLARHRLDRNLRLPLPEQKIGDCSPYFRKPVSDTGIQGVGDFLELERVSVLGHGNHGSVYKVCHRGTLAIYALKIIRDDTTNHETEILSSTNSPFIVQCHGIFKLWAGEKAILMEYMDGGTLDTLLQANGPFSEVFLADIAYQVISGLKYLHGQNIVHLDIKPSNILVSKDMKVKISDFGVSKAVNHELGSFDLNFCEGTRAYMSPERLDSDRFGSGNVHGGDVWSLGVTLLELCVGHFPFFPPGKRPSWMELVLVICFGELPSFPKEASEQFRSFIKCCLEKDPCKRWTASQLLSHPFVSFARGLEI